MSVASESRRPHCLALAAMALFFTKITRSTGAIYSIPVARSTSRERWPVPANASQLDLVLRWLAMAVVSNAVLSVLPGSTRCRLSAFRKSATQFRRSGSARNWSGQFVRGSFAGHRKSHLVTEGREARIGLIAHHERVGEEIDDACIAVVPGAIEPLEGLRRVVAKGVHLGDLVSRTFSVLRDQGLEGRIGRASVTADLRREGDRAVAPRTGRLLLRGGECRPRIFPLDLDDREPLMTDSCTGLQFDGPAGRAFGLSSSRLRPER
jgi:hypothetical protein